MRKFGIGFLAISLMVFAFAVSATAKDETSFSTSITLDGRDTRPAEAWSCGKFRLDGWRAQGQVFWRLALGSDYGGDFTVTLPRKGEGWAITGDWSRGANDANPATPDMAAHGYSPAADPTVTVGDTQVRVQAPMQAKQYFNITFAATRDAADDVPISIAASLSPAGCSKVPDVTMTSGNKSSECTVDWTASAYMDADLDDYPNNGYEYKVSSTYFGDPGMMEMQHWMGPGTLFWRIPIYTDYAMQNAVVTVDLPEGFNDAPEAGGYFEPKKAALYPTEVKLDASAFSVSDGKLTVTIGSLPAKSRTIFQVVGTAPGTVNQAHDTFHLLAHLKADYVLDTGAPSCATPSQTPAPSTAAPSVTATATATQPGTKPGLPKTGR